MANPYDIVSRPDGLGTHENDLSYEGQPLAVADNVVVNRDGMIERRRGFKDFSSNLPDFHPDQLFTSSNGVDRYLVTDAGIWYYDTSGNEWLRKSSESSTRFYANGSATRKGLWTDDSSGVTYLTDASTVYALNLRSGSISILAGLTGTTGNTNATGTAARFTDSAGIVGDGAGNLYVCANSAIRKIVISTGVVTTLAGTSGTTGFTDATGGSARFNACQGITFDGTDLYVADTSNHAIRKVTLAGVVTTVAGAAPPTPTTGTTDATGTSARFNLPGDIVYTTNGLYVVDGFASSGNNRIRNITLPGLVVSTPYNPGGLFRPAAIGWDVASSSVYFSDRGGTTPMLKMTVPGHSVSTFISVANSPGIRASSGRLFFFSTSGIAGKVNICYPSVSSDVYSLVGSNAYTSEGTASLFVPFPDGIVVGPP